MATTQMSEQIFTLKNRFPDDDLTFDSFQTVRDWLEEEQPKWQWILNPSEPSTQISAYQSIVQSSFNQLRSKIQTCIDSDGSQKQSRILELEQHLLNWGSSGSSMQVTSSSEIGQYILALARIDFKVAVETGLAVLQNYAPPIQLVEGRAAFTVFKLGLRAGKFSDVPTVSQLNRETSLNRLVEGIGKTWNTKVKEFDGSTKAYTDRYGEKVRDFEKLIEEARTDLEEHKKVFSEQIVLQAPVQYWEQRARQCTIAAWIMCGVFFLLLIASVAGVAYLINGFFLPEFRKDQAADRWWLVSLLFLIAGSVAWPLRIIAKLWLSNEHLATDARERKVLANVYLAMLKENNAIQNAEDRRIILTTLFQSASTGIVKEDGSPTPVIEVIDKIVGRS